MDHVVAVGDHLAHQVRFGDVADDEVRVGGVDAEPLAVHLVRVGVELADGDGAGAEPAEPGREAAADQAAGTGDQDGLS